jgi:hypothetical protein
MLRMRGRFTDADVRQVVELAACGLVQDCRQRGVTSEILSIVTLGVTYWLA